jgi:hypothetical protein
VRPAPTIEQDCRRCVDVAANPRTASGRPRKCVYAGWSAAYIWLEIKQRLEDLANDMEDDRSWAVKQQRAVLNLVWHYRNGGRAE